METKLKKMNMKESYRGYFMENKCFRKISSIFLSFCILTTIFSCLMGLQVSAITATKMIHVDNAKTGYISYQWRPNEYTNVIKPSTRYRVSFYWENISNASLDTKYMFYAKYYNNSSWQVLFNTGDLTEGDATDKAIYKTDLSHGQKIDFDFTTPSNCRDGGSVCFLFGDWNWALGGSTMSFNLAEIKLYTRDSSDNLTEVSLADICSNETVGTCSNSNPTSTRGSIMRNTTRGTGSEITFQTIPSGYFDPYVEATPQMIHFPAKCADNYQVLCYKGGAISAGVYRFTVDECAVGGIKSYVQIWVNSGNATSGYNGSMDIESGTEDILSGTERTIYFRLWGNKDSFIVMIGNYGKGVNMDTYYKNPQLYKIESGNPTGENLIENFNTNNVELKTGTNKDNISTGKWTSINWSDGYIVAEDVDDDKFTPVYRDGDYNNDNKTDIIDLVFYENVCCGNMVTLQSLDCDEDGTVDDADFKELVNIILGINTYTLQNTQYKLEKGDTVNVAYIGGSVTGGTGSTDASQYSWRARTTAWLQSKYPSATVNEINMGIGGTGSYLGAARFENNIVSKNPDLVFVEFAVNDGYNSISTEQTKQDIEYMIRCLNDNHPYCDMVFVMVTDRYKLGTQFTKLLEIKEVADYYGIPIIDAGAAMNEALGGSTDSWDTYFTDMVHPNDAGYEIYANAITSGLEKLMVNGSYSKHRLKNVKLSLYTPDYVNLLTRDTYNPFKWGKLDSDWGAEWWNTNTDYEILGTPFRTSYKSLSEIFSKYIYPLSDGADLTFTVKGTSIGILGNIKADQTLTVNIDGTDYVLSGSNTTNMTEYPVINNLSDVNHTVTVTANGSGPYIAIAAVVVAG